jgi:voltage-gated potassium channel
VDYYNPNAKQLDRDLGDLRRRMIRAIGVILLVTGIGVVGFSIIDPSAGLVRAFFMTAITLTTVGYGEEIPIDTDGARVFTVVLILVGMGAVLHFVSTGTAFLLEGQLGHVFRRRRMERELDGLDRHHIVCGSGPTAIYAAAELSAVHKSVVLVATSAEGAERARGELGDMPIVMGDPTDDGVLRAAGIERAVGLLACTESDNENVVVTLSARQLNPGIRIVSRVEDADHTSKARKVGADATVSPQHIGGLRLASELVRPTVVTFLDQMLRDRDLNLRIDEVLVPAGSPMVGRPLSALQLDELPEVLVLALREGGTWKYNPSRSHVLAPDVLVVVLGTPVDMQELRKRAGGGAGVARVRSDPKPPG